MKFNCEKNNLLDSINTVQKAVLNKSTLAILEGILIQADENIKLTGNNLEMGIESSFNAQILEKGNIVVNSKLIGEIVRKLPDDIVYFEVTNDDFINIKCGDSEFNIKGIVSDEFPEIPHIEEEKSIKIPQNILKSMIRQTSFAIGTNENKIILTGSLIEIKDNNITMVSVDGFRLALRNETINNENNNNNSFVIPGKTLNELFKILNDDDTNVEIFLTEKHAMFRLGSCKVVTRLLNGEFLNYGQILPSNSNLKVICKTKDFINSIERASLIITNDVNKYPVVLNISLDKIKISCTTNMGKVNDLLKVQTFGDNIEIGFNHKYLIDALKACECETIVLEFTDSLSPCIIKPVEGESFIFLVLPVRLKS
jgi:DNA polymerase-3 subunit beta